MARRVLSIYEGRSCIHIFLSIDIIHSTSSTKTTPSGLPDFFKGWHQSLRSLAKGWYQWQQTIQTNYPTFIAYRLYRQQEYVALNLSCPGTILPIFYRSNLQQLISGYSLSYFVLVVDILIVLRCLRILNKSLLCFLNYISCCCGFYACCCIPLLCKREFFLAHLNRI